MKPTETAFACLILGAVVIGTIALLQNPTPRMEAKQQRINDVHGWTEYRGEATWEQLGE